MVKKRFLGRLNAAAVCAALLTGAVITPVVTLGPTISVSADVQEFKTSSFTLKADGVEDGERQANVVLTGDLAKATTLTFTVTTKCKETASIGVYGFGTTIAPKYWYSISDSEKSKYTYSSGGKSTFTFNVPVPSSIQGKINKIGLGVWYPDDNSEFDFKISANGSSSSTDPIEDPGSDTPGTSGGPTVKPTSENDKSGTYTFTDNHDGTATITATLSAQWQGKDPTTGEVSDQCDFLLTQGMDEEANYAPGVDADGNTLPEWKEGDPINSHKFKLEDFHIEDPEHVQLQSFEYTIQADEGYEISHLLYGGGINVEMGTPADTEKFLGKNGYWYNDHDSEAIAELKGLTDIDVHEGYVAENLGSYAQITWDVPKGVQPYVDWSNSMNSVGFQYWWGYDNTKTSEGEDGSELPYEVLEHIHVLSATCTYTKTMTVPYNQTIKGPNSLKLTTGSDTTNQTKLDLASLGLGERDKISAIRFSFKSEGELNKFISGVGVSIQEDKVQSAVGVKDGWYQPGNLCVIHNGPTFDVVWIIPEVIRNAIYKQDGGNVLLGMWYADKEGGDEVKSVTVPTIEYYVYRSQEEDIKIIDGNGNELSDGDTIRLTVGETHQLVINVDGCEFESSRPNVASVDDTGLISALKEGKSDVKVTTPEGQEFNFSVIVSEAVDPDTIIDWDKVFWGDVNVDGEVDLADITCFSKYFLNKISYPLKNATAYENANTQYDDVIDERDMSKLIEQQLGKLKLDDLGPQDPEIRAKASRYKKNL